MYGSSTSSKILGKTIEANNLWAWYQAKNVRMVIYETAGNKDRALAQAKDMEEIAQKAKSAEVLRDEAKARSAQFTYAGMALQLSIVLSSAAILAAMIQMIFISVGVGAVGVYFLIMAVL